MAAPSPNKLEEFPIEKFRDEAAKDILSTLELAKLAVVISGGRQINPESAATYAAQAIELWKKCEEVRKKKIDSIALLNRAAALRAARDRLPAPKTFPASLETCLRFWMPDKKRPEDRMKCYRAYWTNNLIWQRQMRAEAEGEIDSEPIEISVERMIEGDRKNGFKRPVFEALNDILRRWVQKYDLENRRTRARAGAEALKRKRQADGQTKQT